MTTCRAPGSTIVEGAEDIGRTRPIRKDDGMAQGEVGGPDGPVGTSKDSVQLSIGRIASLVGIGVLVVFMLQNTDRVALDLLVWSFTAPLWLVTFVSALVGALVWFGLGIRRRHRRREARRDARDD